jgi:hypothetical protein
MFFEYLKYALVFNPLSLNKLQKYLPEGLVSKPISLAEDGLSSFIFPTNIKGGEAWQKSFD